MTGFPSTRIPSLLAGLCAVLALAAAPSLAAREKPPEVSPEGLHLVKSSRDRLVYVRPGATLAQYKRVAILDCQVEFKKDWERDFNDSQVGLQDRVTDDDVNRMKTALADEFKKVFTDELQNKGGYQVVDVVAPDVLLLRPALINVDVYAPDLQTPGFTRTVVRSAGQMTLFLELWDPSNKTLLARVMDAEEDPNSMPQVASSVSNRSAADRILREWAKDLREHLDAATKGSASK
jgi:hypothetical protein